MLDQSTQQEDQLAKEIGLDQSTHHNQSTHNMNNIPSSVVVNRTFTPSLPQSTHKKTPSMQQPSSTSEASSIPPPSLSTHQEDLHSAEMRSTASPTANQSTHHQELHTLKEAASNGAMQSSNHQHQEVTGVKTTPPPSHEQQLGAGINGFNRTPSSQQSQQSAHPQETQDSGSKKHGVNGLGTTREDSRQKSFGHSVSVPNDTEYFVKSKESVV